VWFLKRLAVFVFFRTDDLQEMILSPLVLELWGYPMNSCHRVVFFFSVPRYLPLLPNIPSYGDLLCRVPRLRRARFPILLLQRLREILPVWDSKSISGMPPYLFLSIFRPLNHIPSLSPSRKMALLLTTLFLPISRLIHGKRNAIFPSRLPWRALRVYFPYPRRREIRCQCVPFFLPFLQFSFFPQKYTVPISFSCPPRLPIIPSLNFLVFSKKVS